MKDWPSIDIIIEDTVTRQVLEQGVSMEGWSIGGRPPSVILTDRSDAKSDRAATIRIPAQGKIRLGGVLEKLRQSSGTAARALSGHIEFAHFSLNLGGLSLTDMRDGQTIILTEKERDIFVRLYEAGGMAVDRKTLLADIWDYADTVETHTLETHIYRLRQKVEDDPAKPVIVVTEGNGYLLGAT